MLQKHFILRYPLIINQLYMLRPCRPLLLAWLLPVLLLQLPVFAQTNTSLPRSNPEAEGVSSQAVIDFLDAAAKSKTEFHSFMLLRHGKVIAEGWWNPYRPDLKHTLYSCSKSFTATAIGFAVQEKKLSVKDKVISFFPNDLPDTVSTWLKNLSVQDLLIMAVGQEPDPTFTVASRDSNWTRGFLRTPIMHEPGTTFLYNSLGTYMLSAIIQKVTGETTLSYLTPRLFKPLGITGMDWEKNPQGINTGGWGLRLKTEDMAKFAQLFLQKGKWNGAQLLPAAWIEEASSMHILQEPNAPASKKDSSDWLQGYGYQMWRCRNSAYRGDGAYGQFMIVMPGQDAVLAITAETPDMQEEINLVWQHLLPGFKTEKLPADKSAYAALQQKIEGLALPVPVKAMDTVAASIQGKTFHAEKNSLGLTAIAFAFNNNICEAVFTTATGAHTLAFAPGSWQFGETALPGPSLSGRNSADTAIFNHAKIAGSYTWKTPGTLVLTLRYIESPHTHTITCSFSGNSLTLESARSQDFGRTKTVITAAAN